MDAYSYPLQFQLREREIVERAEQIRRASERLARPFETVRVSRLPRLRRAQVWFQGLGSYDAPQHRHA